jgi:hypothetical protein
LENGAIAQLGERFNGIEEVVGSIPSGSTKPFNSLSSYSGEIYACFRSKIATSSPPRSNKQTLKARYSNGRASAIASLRQSLANEAREALQFALSDASNKRLLPFG